MSGIAAHTLADRFAWLIDGLCKAIGGGAHRRALEAALAWAIWARMQRFGERLAALSAQMRAGRLRAPRMTRRDTSARPPPPSGEGDARARVERVLPQDFGWLRRLLPETTQFAGALAYLLRDPEVAALVDKAPEAGRILRPLCHAMGVKAPAFLWRRRGAEAALGKPEAPGGAPEMEETATLRLTRYAGEDVGGTAAAIGAEPPAASEKETPTPILPRDAGEGAANATPRPPQVPHHLRPGGLYWNGRRWDWS
jgi:hypothetical protein